MRITSLAAAFAALALAATVSGQPGGPVEENNPALRLPDSAADLGDSPGIIVKLRSGGVPGRVQAQAAGDAVSKLAARGGFAIKEHRALPAGLHVLKTERLSGETFAEQLARVRADADVEFAEPDYRRYPHAFPNDPLYSGQWYLQNRADTPSAVNAEAAWDSGSGDAGRRHRRDRHGRVVRSPGPEAGAPGRPRAARLRLHLQRGGRRTTATAATRMRRTRAIGSRSRKRTKGRSPAAP